MSRARCPQPLPTPRPFPSTRRSERAQSTLEFVGTIPLLALGAALCVQALLLALALLFAQVAADRAARGMPRAQVVASIPSGWRSRARVERTATAVRVHVRPPAVVPGARRVLEVEAASEVAT